MDKGKQCIIIHKLLERQIVIVSAVVGNRLPGTMKETLALRK